MYWERWFEWVTYLEVGEVEPIVVEWELIETKRARWRCPGGVIWRTGRARRMLEWAQVSGGRREEAGDDKERI